MDIRVEIFLEDMSRRFIRITYKSYLLFNTGEERHYLLGFGMYPVKSDASWTRLEKGAVNVRGMGQRNHT